MTVAFRTDASTLIGSGHVMRCLTLARELRSSGAEVLFVSREHPGNLNALLGDAGIPVIALPAPTSEGPPRSSYHQLLGTSQEVDADQTSRGLGSVRPDWIVVDHYALDAAWERVVRTDGRRLMAIDDLANRVHDCDLLLDQNHFPSPESRYRDLVPKDCGLLLGPTFALLRPEFAAGRNHMASRDGRVGRILVFFGGVDATDMTTKALEALSDPEFRDLYVDVVIGKQNPHADAIRSRVAGLKRATLHVQVDNMGELMATSDLALGAGGSTTWERMCLGLPSLVVTLAENQAGLTAPLAESGLVEWIGDGEDITMEQMQSAIRTAVDTPSRNLNQSRAGMELVDGDGASRVVSHLLANPRSADRTWHRRKNVSRSCRPEGVG